MMRYINLLIKYSILGVIGGFGYIAIELIYRGYSHWTMAILGAMCFICLGLINELLSWETPLWIQALVGGIIITGLEFLTGCIVNIWLKWDIWHYDNLDILGQICVPFSFMWCILSIVGIVLDDWLRFRIFNEEKPKYKWR